MQFVPGLRRLEFAAVLLLELGAQFGLGEPVLAIGPADGVGHRRQRPVVRRVLRPLGIADDRRVHEVVHGDLFFVEEVVQLDVVAVLGRPADPLAVADDEVAKLAVRVELVDETVGVARPGDELVFHLDAGLLGEVLAELDQRVRRIPRRPAERQRLVLGLCGSRSRDDGRDLDVSAAASTFLCQFISIPSLCGRLA